MFHPGQEVVCIKSVSLYGLVGVEKGKHYTIAAVYRAGEVVAQGILTQDAVQLMEFGEIIVPDPEVSGESFYGFSPRLFRPVHRKSTETGMAILRKIADGVSDLVRT